MTSNETWKLSLSVPEYEVSSLGRIRRITFEAPMPNGGIRVYGGKAWPGTWTEAEPRPVFRFRRKTYRVAKLVCEAFHGRKPFVGAVVMHRDDDPRNNRPENLKWGTQKENLNSPRFLVHCRSRIYENSPAEVHRRRVESLG